MLAFFAKAHRDSEWRSNQQYKEIEKMKIFKEIRDTEKGRARSRF